MEHTYRFKHWVRPDGTPLMVTTKIQSILLSKSHTYDLELVLQNADLTLCLKFDKPSFIRAVMMGADTGILAPTLMMDLISNYESDVSEKVDRFEISWFKKSRTSAKGRVFLHLGQNRVTDVLTDYLESSNNELYRLYREVISHFDLLKPQALDPTNIRFGQTFFLHYLFDGIRPIPKPDKEE